MTPAQPVSNVSPAEAEALLKNHPDLLVIDIRTPEEFAEGHIPGARNVNFNAPAFLERMQAFSGKSILVHCAAGGRSGRSLEGLKSLPLQKIYHLNEGFNAWQEAGKPVSTR
jgi:rhodanese-related sulfurtransferase